MKRPNLNSVDQRVTVSLNHNSKEVKRRKKCKREK